MSLLYYLDIGNTRAKFWSIKGDAEVARVAITHNGDMAAIADELSAKFCAPDGLFVACVLGDAAEQQLSQSFRAVWARIPQYARSSLEHAGVMSAYGECAAALGVDRWLGLIALRSKQSDVCVVDCGTAITVDLMRHDGQHLGGYILPGMTMMQSALCLNTQRIFVLEGGKASVALGCNTSDAVRNGGLSAVVALLEKVVRDWPSMRLVLTGGDAHRVSSCLSAEHEHLPDLLLQGLQRYFDADALT